MAMFTIEFISCGQVFIKLMHVPHKIELNFDNSHRFPHILLLFSS